MRSYRDYEDLRFVEDVYSELAETRFRRSAERWVLRAVANRAAVSASTVTGRSEVLS